ncbi:MAG: flippase-like domain-containing protein [Deltaproteobacteria bacterium]|nr:flippase-like domain-containing protein [Deltaproteobacteria bacterium]
MSSAIPGEESLKNTDRHQGVFWLGIAVSAFFLFLVFRSIDGAKLLTALRTMDLRFLVPAVAATLFSYYLRAYRWKLLLREDKQTSMANLFSATAIGYMANNLLPARVGELVRVYLLGEKEGIDKGTVFASLVLDRLFDGFSVLFILLATLFTLQLPGDDAEIRTALVTGGYVTVAVYLAIVIFLVLLKKKTVITLRFAALLLKPFPARLAEKVIPLLGSFIKGIRLTSQPAILAGLVASSVAIWAFALWPIDLALQSFGIELPLTASLFIMVLLVIAVLVPASPGYIGTYHYACFKALTAFGISGEQAVSVALVIHALNFFPITLVGLYYLARGRMSLSGIGKKGGQDQ